MSKTKKKPKKPWNLYLSHEDHQNISVITDHYAMDDKAPAVRTAIRQLADAIRKGKSKVIRPSREGK